ncbi:MAG: hypothetical protein AB7Q42_21860, partial [Acidimicrobiia bacterium]
MGDRIESNRIEGDRIDGDRVAPAEMSRQTAEVDLDALPHPSRSFASDNAATVHPAVLDALARANVGHALAYGY